MTNNTDMMKMIQQMTPEQMQLMMATMANIMTGAAAAGAESMTAAIPHDDGEAEYVKAANAAGDDAAAGTGTASGTYYRCFEAGRIDCIKTADAFQDDTLYRALFRLVTDEIRQHKLQYQLEQKAKELGGTALATMFRQTCTAAKRKYKKEKEEEDKKREAAEADLRRQEEQTRRAAGHKTEYTNLPKDCQQMYVGEEWIANDDGVKKFEESGKTIKEVEACMYPILVSKLYRPLDNMASGATRRVEVHFGSEEGWQKATVEREVISNVNKIISLSNMGAGITSDNARQCVNFMASMMKESSRRGALKIVNTLNKLGWDKEFKNFLPYTTDDYVFERQDELPDMMAALSEQGNRDAWYAKFKEIRALGYEPFKLATAGLLASVILPMLPKQDGFIVNLYGGSGHGKSALLSIVSTIFSNMDNKSGGIFLDSDNTLTSLELACDTFNNFPVILDDASKGDQDKKRKFQEAVMMLANGRGRGRATKDLKQRKRNTFELTSLVSSEQVITKDYSTNGSIYRVLPKQVDEYLPYLDKEKYPKLENIEDVIWFFQNNYGFCGRDFVEEVKKLGQQQIMERNKKNLERARKLAKEHGREGRQATAIAVLLTADEIATEFLFKDGQTFSDEELLNIMVKPDDADQYVRFYNTVIERCISNPGKIEGFTAPEDIRGEYIGIYKKEDKREGIDGTFESISIFPYKLQEWAKELDLDLSLFYKEMRGRGLLISDKGTNQTKAKSEKTGRNERVIKLIMPVYKDEKEEAKEGSKEGAKSAEEAAAAAKDAAAAAKAAAEKASQAAQQAANAKYIEQLRLEAGMTDDEDIPFD